MIAMGTKAVRNLIDWASFMRNDDLALLEYQSTKLAIYYGVLRIFLSVELASDSTHEADESNVSTTYSGKEKIFSMNWFVTVTYLGVVSGVVVGHSLRVCASHSIGALLVIVAACGVRGRLNAISAFAQAFKYSRSSRY